MLDLQKDNISAGDSIYAHADGKCKEDEGEALPSGLSSQHSAQLAERVDQVV